jgi:DNA-binding response OmpR family regulator
MKDNKISPAGEPASAPLQCQPNPVRRILVVEDEPDIRHLNAQVLTNSGFEVDTAEDGRAGWKAVSHAPDSYALLITDHNMPGLTGLALVKKLRDARMTLPVIMATGALPGGDLFVRYPWLQPAVALLKPYTVEQLLGTVRKFLRATDDACPPREIGGAEARPMEYASGGAGRAAEVVSRGEPGTSPPNGRRQPSEYDLQLW